MPSSIHRRHVLPAMIAFLVLLIGLAGVMPAYSDGPMYTRQERFGLAFVTRVNTPDGIQAQSLHDYDVNRLQVGWYSDWQYSATPDMPADTTLEYVQLIRVRDANWPPDWGEIRNAAELNPGSTWLIGNEPECPNQDAVTPQVYAERYREALTNLKGWDPTAQIAIGAIVEPTPLRLLWLERAMEAYQQAYGEAMPVDVWNIHIQILSEGAETPGGYDNKAGAGVPVGIDPEAEGIDPLHYTLADCAEPAILQDMVWDFREWMADHGQREKPLIISEMGVLQPSIYLVEGGSEEERKQRGDRAIEAFMTETFDWLLTTTDDQVGCPADENRLVQRWLWFSLNGSFYDEATNPKGFNGSLYDYRSKEPTRFGIWFMRLQHGNQLFVPVLRQE